MLCKSYHILLWEIKTIIMKRFYVSYLWVLKRKKLIYFIKLLVASWKTPPTFHAVFLPRPLNVDTVSQPEIAYQNGNALHVSSLNTLDIHVLVATFFADQLRIPSKVHQHQDHKSDKEKKLQCLYHYIIWSAFYSLFCTRQKHEELILSASSWLRNIFKICIKTIRNH